MLYSHSYSAIHTFITNYINCTCLRNCHGLGSERLRQMVGRLPVQYTRVFKLMSLHSLFRPSQIPDIPSCTSRYISIMNDVCFEHKFMKIDNINGDEEESEIDNINYT